MPSLIKYSITLVLPIVLLTCANNQLFIISITPYLSDDGGNYTAFYGGSVDVVTVSGASNTYNLDILTIGDQGLGYENDSRGQKYIRISEERSYFISLASDDFPRVGPMRFNLHLANSFSVHGVTEDSSYSVFPSPSVTPIPADSPNNNSNPYYFVSSGRGKIRDYSNLRTYSFTMW